MKKQLLLSTLTIGLLIGCKSNTNNHPPVDNNNYFPLDEVKTFLLDRGADLSNFDLPLVIKGKNNLLSYSIYQDESKPHFDINVADKNGDLSNIYYNQLDGLNWDLTGDIYVDPYEQVGLELSNEEAITKLSIYAYVDLVEVPEPEEPTEELTKKTFDLAELINTNNNLDANDDGEPFKFNNTSFFFAKNSGPTPITDKTSSKRTVLYRGNTLTISSADVIKKIVFTKTNVSGYNGELTSDKGEVSREDDLTTWLGTEKSVTFTAQDQYRFKLLEIYFYIEPSPEGGEMSIADVYETASHISYIPTHGWYLTDVEVTLKVKAIDAIDSKSTSGIDPLARGKVLCVDSTGYLIVSSGVSKENPIDFYQRVSDSIDHDYETKYVITGHIAFFNDVVEVKVDTYKFNSNLVIDYNLNDFVDDSVTNSDSFMNHCKSIKTNADGYGVGSIVKMDALTYFNKYNSAGSYYFLDQSSKLVPVYSFKDKDRSSLVQGKVYNIIGLESLYFGRPSLRILKVELNTSVEHVTFDFTKTAKKDSTKYFYNVNLDNSAYIDEYYQSVATIYEMDVYVSSYGADKYTFNEAYYYDSGSKKYTTGTSQATAASHYSLGVFNEDLDYKQTLLDFLVEEASSASEANECKLTLYFTLAFLDTVDGRKMWRVNIFEDLVFSLDYYESSAKTITCNSTDATFSTDATSQTYSDGNLSIINADTDVNEVSWTPLYLKIVDGTSLRITFDHDIIGFTLYHATYSRIAGLGELNVRAYRQFKKYTVILLAEPTNDIYIDDFAVGGNRNNAYLRVDSIQVNYLEA